MVINPVALQQLQCIEKGATKPMRWTKPQVPSRKSKEFLKQLAQDSLELYNRTLLRRIWAQNAKDQTHKADSKIGKLITTNF